MAKRFASSRQGLPLHHDVFSLSIASDLAFTPDFLEPDFGTALFAFYQMMLNGGTYNGVQILSRASVEAMTTLHTGDLPALLVPGPWPTTAPVPTRPDFGYGLGLYIIGEPSAAPALALATIGSYGHAGSFGTFAWVDPKKDLVGVFLIQRHFGLKPGHGPERWTFMAMAAAAIVD